MYDLVVGGIFVLSVIFLIINIIVKQNTKDNLSYKIEPYQEFRRGFYFTLGSILVLIIIKIIFFLFKVDIIKNFFD